MHAIQNYPSIGCQFSGLGLNLYPYRGTPLSEIYGNTPPPPAPWASCSTTTTSNMMVTTTNKFGCAMGSPIGQVLVDLVMEEIEETAISTFPHPTKWWFRYVDGDSHCCLKKDLHKHPAELN